MDVLPMELTSSLENNAMDFFYWNRSAEVTNSLPCLCFRPFLHLSTPFELRGEENIKNAVSCSALLFT